MEEMTIQDYCKQIIDLTEMEEWLEALDAAHSMLGLIIGKLLK